MSIIDRLDEWLNHSKDTNEPIVFFDDGVYSGKQIVSIFQEYMGIPVASRTTNEDHVPEPESENLKKTI